jgi:hypothetical protein
MEWRTEEDGERLFYLWADILVGPGHRVEEIGKRIDKVLHDRHYGVLNGVGFGWTHDDSGREVTAGTVFEVVLTTDDDTPAVRTTLTSLPELVAGIERVELLDREPAR